jgi:hypothetical protein
MVQSTELAMGTQVALSAVLGDSALADIRTREASAICY